MLLKHSNFEEYYGHDHSLNGAYKDSSEYNVVAFPKQPKITKTLVFLGGYANAGKSTAVKWFRKQGIEVFSSSELLHDHIENMMGRLHTYFDSYDRSGSTQLNNLTIPHRDFMIALAEATRQIIDGEIYMKGVMGQAIASKSELVVVETVGGHEYEIGLKMAREQKDLQLVNVNIRMHSELPGVDIRELLPYATDIYNNGTKEDLYRQLMVLKRTSTAN